MAWTVGVAGCGVAGLTAALMLARRGHRVTIHEQAERLGPVGAGVLLQPSGQSVLRAMGLMDAAVASAARIERLTAFTHRGKQLIDLPYGEMERGACAYGLQRGDLFTALHRAALEAGVVVRMAQRITGYARRGAGIWFEESAPAGGAGGAEPRHGPYDFVLAADGARSTLRQKSTVRASAAAYPHGALWATGPCSGVVGRLLQKCRGASELCGILPTGRGRASLFWGIRNDCVEKLRSRGFEAWRSDVVGLCPEAAELFTGAGGVAAFEDVQFVSYMRVHIRKPYDDGCLFLGDAAHAMSPHLGQGINLALIDGYVFAEALAEASDFASACRGFAAERARHLRAYRMITYWLSPFFQSRGRVLGWGRDLVLPWMPRVPGLRRQMVQTMAGCRAGLYGGAWQLGEVECLSGTDGAVYLAAGLGSKSR